MAESSHLQVWDLKTAVVKTKQDQQSAESAPTGTAAPAKPLYVLWAPAHSCHMTQLSSINLLAVPGRIGDVHVSINFIFCEFLTSCPLTS